MVRRVNLPDGAYAKAAAQMLEGANKVSKIKYFPVPVGIRWVPGIGALTRKGKQARQELGARRRLAELLLKEQAKDPKWMKEAQHAYKAFKPTIKPGAPEPKDWPTRIRPITEKNPTTGKKEVRFVLEAGKERIRPFKSNRPTTEFVNSWKFTDQSTRQKKYAGYSHQLGAMTMDFSRITKPVKSITVDRGKIIKYSKRARTKRVSAGKQVSLYGESIILETPSSNPTPSRALKREVIKRSEIENVYVRTISKTRVRLTIVKKSASTAGPPEKVHLEVSKEFYKKFMKMYQRT